MDGNCVNLARNRIEWGFFAINTLIMNESFVYLWRDSLKKRYYLGYHSGYNPNYICSSKHMMKEYKKRPNDFKRKILKTGSRDSMFSLEQKLLRLRKNQFGKRYYNLGTSYPNLHNHHQDPVWRKKWLEANNKARVFASPEKMKKIVKAQWSKRTPEQKKAIADKISATVKRRWAEGSYAKTDYSAIGKRTWATTRSKVKVS